MIRGRVKGQKRRDRSQSNEPSHSVRKGAAAPKAADRRIRKTRQSLVHALIELVLAKRYAAITVQDLLDRADVGRSTFYAHYRGKDDLLLSSFAAMLEMLDQALDGNGPASRRVAPVAELFRHVGKFGKFHRALGRAHMLDRVYQVGAETLSLTIERRLAARERALDSEVPAAVRARALSGALFAMLRWWVDANPSYSPERMDEMFHATFDGPAPAGSWFPERIATKPTARSDRCRGPNST